MIALRIYSGQLTNPHNVNSIHDNLLNEHQTRIVSFANFPPAIATLNVMIGARSSSKVSASNVLFVK